MKNNRAKEALKNLKQEFARVKNGLKDDPNNPRLKDELGYLELLKKYWENEI